MTTEIRKLSISCRWFMALAIGIGTFGLARLSHGQPVYSQVTGQTSDTVNGDQAETMCNVSVVQGIQNVADGSSIEIVTYNDLTPSNFVQFPNMDPSNRTLLPGASLMGWSYRVRTSLSADTAWVRKSMSTPSGWAVLVGDPSLASNAGKPNYVFLGNLAMPQDKFDFYTSLHGTPGRIVGAIQQNPPPIGGGCVARSIDGGQNFVLVGCVRDTSVVQSNSSRPDWATSDTYGHFYDGSSMAVTFDATSNVGSAFIAFDDTETQREAVWIMPDIAANLTATAPFDAFQPDGVVGNVGTLPDDSLGEIETHVRLRAVGTDLWKMSAMYRDPAQCKTAFASQSKLTTFVPADLKINVRNRSGNAVDIAEDAVIGEGVDFGTTVAGAELAMRTGPQFAFDLGTNEQGDFEMRYVYMAADSPAISVDANNNCVVTSTTGQNFRLKGGWCDQNLNCHPVPEWSTTGSSDAPALFPAIKYALIPGTNTPAWKVTFQGRNPQNNSQVAIFAGDLVRQPAAQTASPLVTLAVTSYQTPCPTNFANDKMSSYWGDYDDMTFDPNTEGFIRSFVDSSLGCLARGNLISQHVHASTVELPIRTPFVATAVSAGFDHTCAIRNDQTIWCWGNNSFGQLGNGNSVSSSVPVQVQTPSAWSTANQIPKYVSSGRDYTCALLANSNFSSTSVWCWGYNAYGQLGNGTQTNSNTPVQVSGLSGTQLIVTGGYHACAQQLNTSLWCWGNNGDGELGIGTTGGVRTTPVAVMGALVQNVSAGDFHTCAIQNGTTYCWGDNSSGALGTGTLTNSNAPVAVLIPSGYISEQVVAGADYTCAIRGHQNPSFPAIIDNTTWCWGSDRAGQLGDGSPGSPHPAQLSSFPLLIGSPPISLGTLGYFLSAGGSHACAISPVLHQAGCWGANGAGQLGNGTTTNSDYFVYVWQDSSQYASITGLTAGGGHTCALLTDNSAVCWGLNSSGQLGNGTTANRSLPAKVYN